MHYPPDLQSGRFLRRVNRFLAEVDLAGMAVSAHVANSGRNRELFTVGRQVLLAPQPVGPRKTAFDLSLVRFNRRWVSVDARLPNRLVEEAWRAQKLLPFGRYGTVAREVALGDSRIDLLFGRGDEQCCVEVKSVTLVPKRSPSRTRCQFDSSGRARNRRSWRVQQPDRRRSSDTSSAWW
ncbi:MAG: hypothetical protein COZ06_16265 [Armatimonadetes bacterium CG_4_10_14_3_um_filter_66_18]|nr:MAG: hypothetical protein COZ06_16265 [Armatimonadetes bacterium CG_4_10_14_3_um_filter_66_18]